MAPQRRLVGVLDNIRSLYNVGSMFRTADAFAIEHLYLCGMTGAPTDERLTTRIAKTSLGAEQVVPWTSVAKTQDAIQQMRTDGWIIVSLEQTPTAIPLNNFHADAPKIALVVGHELYGVHADTLSLADHHIMIPMLGQKESLNVAVAFGVATAWLRLQ